MNINWHNELTQEFNRGYETFFEGPALIEENHPTYGHRLLAYDGGQHFNEFWNCMYFLLESYEGRSLNFLEIGAAKGLWPYTLNVFSEAYDIDLTYTTVTMMSQDIRVNQYLPKVGQLFDERKFTLIDADSTSPEAYEPLASNFDVVFIDANHDYDYVMKDIHNYAHRATDLLIFHDIRPLNGGVARAVIENDIAFDHEFIENEQIMGIGIKEV